jgi:hypothetical protein
VSAFIRIGDFDERAAVELAMRLRAAIQSGLATKRVIDLPVPASQRELFDSAEGPAAMDGQNDLS